MEREEGEVSDIEFLEEVRNSIENDSDAYWEFNGRDDAKRLLDIIRGYQVRTEKMEAIVRAARSFDNLKFMEHTEDCCCRRCTLRYAFNSLGDPDPARGEE